MSTSPPTYIPSVNSACLEQMTALISEHRYAKGLDFVETNSTTWGRPQVADSTTDGFTVTTYNFTNVCAELGGAFPINNTDSLPTAVLNISKFAPSGPSATLKLYVSSCDGTGELNITAPGIYAVNGSAAMLLQRVPSTPGLDQSSSNCTGSDEVVFTTSSYSDFCRIHSDRSECKSASEVKTSTPTPSSTATKISTGVALAGALLMVVGGL